MSVVTGLMVMVIALVWLRRRNRRDKMAEINKDERIDLFHHDSSH